MSSRRTLRRRVARRLGAALAAFVTSAASLAAQDAAQVRRVNVGFNTLKNSTSLSDAQRAEVDRLGKLALEANQAGQYGEALKNLYHGMAVMRGTEWTPATALGAAMTLKLDRAVLEPSGKVEVRLGRLFALAEDERMAGPLTGSVTLLKKTGDDPVAVLGTVGPIEGDLSGSLIAHVAVPKVPDGSYRISVSLRSATASSTSTSAPAASPTGTSTTATAPATDGAARPLTRTVPVRIEKDLVKQVDSVKGRLQKTAARLKAKGDASLLAALPSAEYRLALVDLVNSGDVNPDRVDFDAELTEARAILEGLGKDRDPLASRRGDFKKAYRSEADDTLQPYRVFVPTGYDASKAFPLIVALHGMGGDENSYFDGYGNGAFKVEAERRGYLVACPKGRQSASMYIGTAEKDVFDVIAQVRGAYKVDPDRIYLTGHSMGGYGTWSFAMAHPDLFAAIAPVSGGGNPGGLGKIAHVPELVVHGDNDKTVSVEQSRRMVAAAKEQGIELKYVEIPGGDHVSVALRTFKDVFDWFDAHRRQAPKTTSPASER
jgi:predicted esterase